MFRILWTLMTLFILFIDLHSSTGWKTTRQEFEKFIKWNNQENYHITFDLIRFTTNRIKICTENKGFHIDKNVFSNFLSSSKDKACDLLDTLGVMNCKRYNDKSYHQFEEFSHLYEDTHGSVNQYKENWRGINVEFCSEIAEKKKDQWNPELLHKYAIVLRNNFCLHMYTARVHKCKCAVELTSI